MHCLASDKAYEKKLDGNYKSSAKYSFEQILEASRHQKTKQKKKRSCMAT